MNCWQAGDRYCDKEIGYRVLILYMVTRMVWARRCGTRYQGCANQACSYSRSAQYQLATKDFLQSFLDPCPLVAKGYCLQSGQEILQEEIKHKESGSSSSLVSQASSSKAKWHRCIFLAPFTPGRTLYWAHCPDGRNLVWEANVFLKLIPSYQYFSREAMDERSRSAAVTASELARVRTNLENREGHELVFPDASIDFAKVAENPISEARHTYVLRQTSYNAQSLISTAESMSETYSIKLHTPGGFMKKHPHMIITRDFEGRTIRMAEIWDETHSYGSRIVYVDSGVTQRLARDGPTLRRFTCSINEVSYTWQPLGPSGNVLELTNELGKRAALFVWAEMVYQRSNSDSGRSTQAKGIEIGNLHIMDHIMGEQGLLEKVCCTAVVVVEKVKQKVKISGFSY